MEISRDFYNWMIKTKGLVESTANINFSRVVRINYIYDIYAAYLKDGCMELLALFRYSKKTADLGIPPEHDVVIHGNVYTGTQSLKYALKLYVEYLNDADLLIAAHSAAGVAPEKSLRNMTDEEFDAMIEETQRLIDQVYEECEGERFLTVNPGKPDFFIGSFEAFRYFVGPFCKNHVNYITRKERRQRKGICEYCGKKDELHAAHRDGEERLVIIKRILDAHFKKGDNYYEVDLSAFEKLFAEAHLPVKDHIFFLCGTCHGIYDNGTGISTADILAKRGASENAAE